MLIAEAVREPRTVFDELREREFSRLDAQHLAYLDYTGSALYAESQLRAHQTLLQSGVFGNPHSDSDPSRASTNVIDDARSRVLRFLDADESDYDVIFTANTSAAIKLVAESYPFTPESHLVLSTDNHNSINGIREYASRAGATTTYLPLDNQLQLAASPATCAPRPATSSLFAFPAQSNFSGVLHPLSLVQEAQANGFHVLIDIAAYIPSHPFSLRGTPADFVAMSFYKLFGYPTGIGALVARRDALAQLNRPWFAGGTVHYASVAANTHRLLPRHAAFEDGTPNFLGIAALDAGFALLDSVQMQRLERHVARLTRELIDDLRALRHRNGAPLARIYGPSSMTNRGGTIAFNILARDGRVLPYSIVEADARRAGVALRGGCFCNPGASEAAFDLGARRIGECLERLGDGFTPERFSACTETAVGALRASIGLANNREDIARAVDVIASFRA